MASYSQEFKVQIVRKLMPPTVLSLVALSRETGIPPSKLYAGKMKTREQAYQLAAKNVQKTVGHYMSALGSNA